MNSDIEKSERQRQNGDIVAANYTHHGGHSTLIGSVLLLEGVLAIGGIAAVMSIAGLIIAAIIITGVLFIAGGFYFHSKAYERIHEPIELWAARSIFGNRANDGEIRIEINLDLEGKLPSYSSVTEETRAWHTEFYSPVMLSNEQALALDLKGLGSKWKNNNAWSPPNWTAIVHSDVTPPQPTAIFTILLREFVIGQSKWSATLFYRNNKKSIHQLDPRSYMTAAGLVIHIESDIIQSPHATLVVNYRPNLGLEESAESIAHFKLEE